MPMTKRQKFVATTLVLCGIFLFSASLENINRILTIGIVSLLSIVLFFWSLGDSLQRNATLVVLIPPALFTLGVGSFWFLLPSNPAAKVPVVIAYGIGLYALSLISNIYSVSAIRTIALLRAAKSVGFVITLFTSFLLFDAIFSARLFVSIDAVLVFITSFLLVLPNLWTTSLDTKIEKKVVIHALSYSFLISLFSTALFFWPTLVVENTIFLTVVLYVLLGMGQANLEGRLFKETAREFLIVAAIVVVSMVLFTSWRG